MIKRLILLCLSLVYLVGCWDQRLLKDHSLILAVGYDLTEEEEIIKTVAFPKGKVSSTEEGESKEIDSEIVTTQGHTVKDAERKIDRIIPMQFDRSKAKVIMIGEDMAKDGIFKPLDSLYRDLRGPLNAKVAIISGTPSDAFHIEESFSRVISDYYAELLDSAETRGVIMKENLQSICPVLLSEGEDIVLPYLQLSEDKKDVSISGLALFSGQKMTDRLNTDQSLMQVLLKGNLAKRLKFNFRVSDDKENNYENYVDFTVRKAKRKLKIKQDGEELRVKIDMKLRIEIDEYSSDDLVNQKKSKALAKEIREALTRLAEETLEKVQGANSDTLGLGQRVRAYHHKYWKTIDWEEVYPDLPIETNFDVEIVRHGIIN